MSRAPAFHEADRPVLVPSFRDPSGTLACVDGRILRCVTMAGADDLNAFLASPVAATLVGSGKLVRSTPLDSDTVEELVATTEIRSVCRRIDAELIVEHERVAFASYPYEWSPEMLHAAARLTLDIAAEILPSGFGLKDATPYNVLFRGPDPVFIDVLSFERRDPRDATWLPYAQFVRTFLLPLLASKYFGLGLDQSLTTRRDGLEPEDVFRWLTASQRFRPTFFSLVTLPTWLARRHDPADTSVYDKKTLRDPDKARFILESILRSLRKALRRLAPSAARTSAWRGYMASKTHYTDEHFRAKQAFVERALAQHRPRRVLDVGCNTGHFTAIAARSGAAVVAIDYDPVVIDEVWRMSAAQRLDILPLVVDLTRPSPGVGWRNAECAGFLDRARSAFDAVFMLAVLHHMLVSERVPLDEVVDLAAELTTDLALIEFVAPQDPMFRRLTRGRDDLHKELTASVFESACRRRFDLLRMEPLGATRAAYLLRKRS